MGVRQEQGVDTARGTERAETRTSPGEPFRSETAHRGEPRDEIARRTAYLISIALCRANS